MYAEISVEDAAFSDAFGYEDVTITIESHSGTVFTIRVYDCSAVTHKWKVVLDHYTDLTHEVLEREFNQMWDEMQMDLSFDF